MPYRLAADLVLVVHALFVVFVLLGGLLVLYRHRFLYLHLPAAAWGALVEFRGWVCPLTPLEQALRRAAGAAGYEGGFIEHYLAAVLYPASLERDTQTAGRGGGGREPAGVRRRAGALPAPPRATLARRAPDGSPVGACAGGQQPHQQPQRSRDHERSAGGDQGPALARQVGGQEGQADAGQPGGTHQQHEGADEVEGQGARRNTDLSVSVHRFRASQGVWLDAMTVVTCMHIGAAPAAL